MAAKMRLTAGGNTWDFSPLLGGYNEPQRRIRTTIECTDGTFNQKEWGNKERHQVSIANVSLADTTQIRSWWSGMTELTFTPDMENASGTTYTVLILNDRQPMTMMVGTWQGKYAGSLILAET